MGMARQITHELVLRSNILIGLIASVYHLRYVVPLGLGFVAPLMIVVSISPEAAWIPVSISFMVY